MSRKPPLLPALLGIAVVLAPVSANAQAEQMSRTTNSRIEDAMQGAPPEISRDATIMAWPETEGQQPTELRSGTNEWTCFASSPTAQAMGGQDPMCMDETGLEFINAYLERREPSVEQVSVIYMLRGDMGASNTDPWATTETAAGDWVVAGPHVMVVVPDPSLLEGLTDDPEQGGPWVMWSGTPWAHVMVPVEEESTGPPRHR